MSSPAESLSRGHVASTSFGSLDRFLRQRLIDRMTDLRGGQLRLHDELGDVLLGEPGLADGLKMRWNARTAGSFEVVVPASHFAEVAEALAR